MEALLLAAFVIYILYSIIKAIGGSKKSSNSFSRPKQPLNEKQLDLSEIELSDEQKALFEKIENSKDHFFITGRAGTGKSMLLQYFKQKSRKSMVVGAFTGVAALNIGAQTLNSLFKLPTGFIDSDKLSINSKTKALLEHIETVVIDEVSMVRADMMDAIDKMLRLARDNDIPFGGVQIVMFGDLFQLAPIVADRELHKYFVDNHGGAWFFNASAWKKAKFRTFELTNIFRQKDDPKFRELLNMIREGHADEDLLESLNVRVTNIVPETGAITLATTNKIVDQMNAARLAALPGEVHEYRAEIMGALEPSYFPTDERLRLKKGAQVMLLKNDKEKRWVNGTIGTVEALTRYEVRVSIDGFTHSIPRETWKKIRYVYNEETGKIEEEIISSFTQFPLRLAWAMTVHKSQGKTYGTMVLDMGSGAFAHGQTYVALSRCRTLDGIYLKRPLRKEDVIVDPAITAFMVECQREEIVIPIQEHEQSIK